MERTGARFDAVSIAEGDQSVSTISQDELLATIAHQSQLIDRLIDHVGYMTAELFNLEVGTGLRDSTNTDPARVRMMAGVSKNSFDLYAERARKAIKGE